MSPQKSAPALTIISTDSCDFPRRRDLCSRPSSLSLALCRSLSSLPASAAISRSGEGQEAEDGSCAQRICRLQSSVPTKLILHALNRLAYGPAFRATLSAFRQMA